MEQKCKSCGKIKKLVGRDLCNACYCKHKANDTLDKFKKTRPRYIKRRKCVECKELRKIVANGLCAKCYRRRSSFCRSISGGSLNFFVPPGDRNQAKKYYKNTREKMLDEIIKNPKKWLNKVTKKDSPNYFVPKKE